MKRSTVLPLAVALLALLGAHSAGAATAPKKAAAPKPVAKVFYLHGKSSNGNQDYNQSTPTPQVMDATAPTGTAPKEILIFGAVATPNTKCAGTGLIPEWKGAFTGNLTGSATVSFYARSSGAPLMVRLFNDITALACNDNFPEPVGMAEIAVPAGPAATLITVTFPVSSKVKFASSMHLQFAPSPGTPQITGLSYDSTVTATSIKFSCMPKVGAKTC